MALFDDWYDYLNPLEYVDYAFGNGDAVSDATNTLGDSKTYWENNKAANQAYLDQYLANVDTNKAGNDAALLNYGTVMNDTKYGNDKLLVDTYGNSLGKYNDLMSKYENMGGYKAGTFDYGKDTKDFMSPAMEMRIKEAQNAVTKSQANAGNMFSSDYLNALNAKSQAMASEEYDKAYNRMMQDRSQKLNEWQAQNAENKAAYDSTANLYSNLISQYGSDRGNFINGAIGNNNNYLTNFGNLTNSVINNNNSYLDELGNYYAQTINNNNAYTQGMTNIDIAKANAEAGHDNGIMNMGNFVLNGVNTFGGL